MSAAAARCPVQGRQTVSEPCSMPIRVLFTNWARGASSSKGHVHGLLRQGNAQCASSRCIEQLTSAYLAGPCAPGSRPGPPSPGSRCHWRLLAACWPHAGMTAKRPGLAMRRMTTRVRVGCAAGALGGGPPRMVTSRAPLSKGRHCAGGGVVKPRYCPASESGIRIAVTRSRLTSSSLLPSCKFDFEPTPDRWS